MLNLVSRMRLRLVCLLEGKKKQAKTVTISFGASKDSLSEVSTITYLFGVLCGFEMAEDG